MAFFIYKVYVYLLQFKAGTKVGNSMLTCIFLNLKQL